MEQKLLPSGFYDLLPPDAARHSRMVFSLLSAFEAFGYEQVSPPLMEFENTLLADTREAVNTQTFRVADPLSQQMMAIRPDMTLQIARIAATRMQNAPLPLRLCYAGPTLRTRAEPLQNARQLWQAGVELIGAAPLTGDAEVILVAVEALETLGVKNITVDLNLPGLTETLLRTAGIPQENWPGLYEALSRKDISALPAELKENMEVLLQAAGPATQALKKLEAANHVPSLAPRLEELAALVSRLQAGNASVNITIDASETRGFEYHTGISFSLFAAGLRNEVGRGGRYRLEEKEGAPLATGFTLYVEPLLRLVSFSAGMGKIFIPAGTAAAQAHALRRDGWATVQGLEAVKDNPAEAARLGCSHVWENGKAVEIKNSSRKVRA